MTIKEFSDKWDVTLLVDTRCIRKSVLGRTVCNFYVFKKANTVCLHPEKDGQ